MNFMKKLAICILVSGLTLASAKSVDYSLANLAGKENLVSVVIIGSGPAGCAAATYAARAGLDTAVLEGDVPGGQLIKTGLVKNWPGIVEAKGFDIMENQRKQASEAGAILKSDSVSLLDLSQWPFKVQTGSGETVHAMAVVITTGSASRMLNVPGEAEYWGHGVSGCAVCDAPFYKNLDVVVVGGGDSAAEEAIQLAPYAKTVTVLVRRDQMRATLAMQKKINDIDTIKIEYNKTIKKVIGDGDVVTGIDVLDVKTKHVVRRAIDGVFLAVGHLPRTDLVKKQLKLDKEGCIALKGRSQKTSIPGVFAAGDVADPVYRQAGVAAGDGSKAERDVEHFLQDIDLTPTKIKSWRTNAHRNGLHFYLS